MGRLRRRGAFVRSDLRPRYFLRAIWRDDSSACGRRSIEWLCWKARRILAPTRADPGNLRCALPCRVPQRTSLEGGAVLVDAPRRESKCFEDRRDPAGPPLLKNNLDFTESAESSPAGPRCFPGTR